MRVLFFLPFLLLAGCTPSSLPPPVAARPPVEPAPEGVPDGYEVALLDPAAAAQSPKAPQAPSDYKTAPNGLGDFLFGMTVAEAEAKCAEVGRLSTEAYEEGATSRWATTRVCLGPKVMAMPMIVGLNFCKGSGRLCEVFAWAPRSAEPGLVLLDAKYFDTALERRFGPPTNTRDEAPSDACLAGKPRSEAVGPYRHNWSWADPAARVLAIFTCDEKERSFQLFASDADGVGARLAKP